jgi:glucosylceramidase
MLNFGIIVKINFMKGNFIHFFVFLVLMQVSCKGKEILVPKGTKYPTDGTIEVYTTNHNGSLKLFKKAYNIKFQDKVTANLNIELNLAQTKQEMEGFGAALTGSSAHVLMNLSASQRSAILKDLFDPIEGIGLKYLRLTMGASDFSLNNFTYNDIATSQQDLLLTYFSIETEQATLIPVLKEILAINPGIKLMGSPWSAPAWMKSNKSLTNGGKVDTAFYQTYANYFVKYIQAFKQNGIQIDAITIQNEPLFAASYMSTEMSAVAQTKFIKNNLGPAFANNNISTKIIIYDHNWDRPDYPLTILADSSARKYIAGTAFHCYGGNVSAMSQVQNNYPDKGIYFTECSGGDFSSDFGNNLAWNAENLMIGSPRNGAKTVLFWNLALDENHGPKNGGCQDCRGVITINSGSQIIDKNVEYFLLGHASKFVQDKAKRLETMDSRAQGFSQIAYLNPDGTKVLLAYNHQSNTQKIQVTLNNQSFNYDIEAGALVTFKW